MRHIRWVKIFYIFPKKYTTTQQNKHFGGSIMAVCANSMTFTDI